MKESNKDKVGKGIAKVSNRDKVFKTRDTITGKRKVRVDRNTEIYTSFATDEEAVENYNRVFNIPKGE